MLTSDRVSAKFEFRCEGYIYKLEKKCEVHLQRKKAKNITNIYAVQLSIAYIPAVYIRFSGSATFSTNRFSGALDFNFLTAK